MVLMLMAVVVPAVAATAWKTIGYSVAHSRGGNLAVAEVWTTTKLNPTDLRIWIASKTGNYGGKMDIFYDVECYDEPFGDSKSVSDSFEVNSNEPLIIKPIANVTKYDRCEVWVSVSNNFKDGWKNFDPWVKVQAKEG